MYTPQQINGSNYRSFIHDQTAQPLYVPRRARTDTQRIAVGSQFTGTRPNAEFGVIGVGGPTEGGSWLYGGDVEIERIFFRSIGAVEPAARGAGSGVFVRRLDGAVQRLVNLENTDIYAATTEPLSLQHGETIFCVTIGATREMICSVIAKSHGRSWQ